MTTPILDEQARRSIELNVSVDVPASAVWAALTDPKELSNWFAPTVSGSSEVGKTLCISWGSPIEWTTTVATADPNRHVRWVDDPSQPLAVDWSIEGRGGKTLLRLVHSGWSTEASWDEQYDATIAGWRYFLFNLRHYLQRHRGTRRTMISTRLPSTIPRAALWDRLMGPDGFALGVRDHAALREGDHVRLQLGADPQRLEIVHYAAPTHLWGTLPGLSDALLMIEMEPGVTEYHCGIWLSTYGLNGERLQSLRDAMATLTDRVVAGSGK
jgi:uncharacterized protein YndB with AHSA1/START domain